MDGAAAADGEVSIIFSVVFSNGDADKAVYIVLRYFLCAFSFFTHKKLRIFYSLLQAVALYTTPHPHPHTA
jgi:hypothetical protein